MLLSVRKTIFECGVPSWGKNQGRAKHHPPQQTNRNSRERIALRVKPRISGRLAKPPPCPPAFGLSGAPSAGQLPTCSSCGRSAPLRLTSPEKPPNSPANWMKWLGLLACVLPDLSQCNRTALVGEVFPGSVFHAILQWEGTHCTAPARQK